jgi:hypothetical protein
MHEAAFARAALPAPCQVLGMALKPFSLGHEVYLERENRYPKPETRILETPLSLIKAVLICCQSWEELQGMTSDWLLDLKLWIWKRRLRKTDWPGELRAFEVYRQEGSLEFPLSDIVRPGSGSGPRPPGTPFLLRLHQFLVIRMRMEEVEAWDYPLGLAKMQWAAYWEEEGGLQIYNWQDAEHDAFVEKCELEEAEIQRRDAKSAEAQGPEMEAIEHVLSVMDGREQMADGKEGGSLA